MKVSREFLIGVVVIVSLTLLYMGVNFLKGVNLFSTQQKYYAVYTNAAGLVSSNPVILNGFKIGIVKDVHMNHNGDGTIVAEIVINDANLKIPDDTRLEIYDADLFGGKAIQIVLGKSPSLAENKDTLASSISLGLTDAIKQEIEPLKMKTSKLFSGVDSLMNSLNGILGGGETQSLGQIFTNLKSTLVNLEGTTAKLNVLLEDNSPKLNAIFSNVESITSNLEKHNGDLGAAISNIKQITDTVAALNLTKTMAQVNAALADFNIVLNSVKTGQGTLCKLITTDVLHAELVEASRSLDHLLDDMRVHPKRYLSFSLIGKKDDAEFSKKELEMINEEIDKAMQSKPTEKN
jgi:phospholipid/cholesterol/gamma-HCH transport system substrate-binding protein